MGSLPDLPGGSSGRRPRPDALPWLRSARSFVLEVAPLAWGVAGVLTRSLAGRTSLPLFSLTYALVLLAVSGGALGTASALGGVSGGRGVWVVLAALLSALWVLLVLSLGVGAGTVLDQRRDRRLLQGAPGVRVRLRDVRLLRVEDVPGGAVRLEVSHGGVDTFLLDADAQPAGTPRNGLSLPSPISLVLSLGAGDVVDARVAERSAALGALEIYGTLGVRPSDGGFVLEREQVSVEFPSWRGSFA